MYRALSSLHSLALVGRREERPPPLSSYGRSVTGRGARRIPQMGDFAVTSGDLACYERAASCQLCIDVAPPEGDDRQEDQDHGGQRHAAEVRPVYAVLDRRAVVVEEGEGPQIFEVFGDLAENVDQVRTEERDAWDGYGESSPVEDRRAQQREP